VGAFAVALVTLSAFMAWELHTKHPMLDLAVFKNPRFSAGSGTITIVFFAMFGSMLLMTQYWQLVHGYSPLEAGVRLLPYAATMMIVAPMSARFVERLGTKPIVLIGLSLVITGLLLLSTIASDSPYPVVIAFFMVMAAGMGMTMAPATEAVMGSLPRAKAGVGSAINDTTRQVGGALGVAVIGTIVTSVYSARIVDLGSVFGLTPPQSAEAEASLGAAQGLAASLGDQADAFATAAGDAFVDAMSIGLRVGAIAVAAAFVIAWRFLPSHARESQYDVIDLPAGSVTEPTLVVQPAPFVGD
jgi:Na+/melibiose symporter-like transporter